MRSALLLTFAAALATTPAAAQPVIPADGAGQEAGPNVRAAQRPMGPNALAARRPVGPNGALVERAGRAGPLGSGPEGARGEGGGTYPNCSAAGAVRAIPVRRGEPGYGRHLDPDGDGVACE
jgi:hypothetical protein